MANELASQAMDAAPDDQLLRSRARAFLQGPVPPWHFSVMNEDRRTEAFFAAIKVAVQLGDLVLDIGTGTGILAMMAAEAGAAHVISCEHSPLLADKARAIIAANGISDRITVVAKSSYKMKVGKDLPRRADLLVCDLFTGTLLAGKGMAVLKDAHERLLQPQARCVPEAAAARCCLIESKELEKRSHLSTIGGFDFSLFNQFAPPRLLVQASEFREADIRLLSATAEPFHFDFRTLLGLDIQETTMQFAALAEGRACGVLQWIWLRFDNTWIMESSPEQDNPLSWPRYYYPFELPLDVNSSDMVSISASHDLEQLELWLQE